MRRLRTCAEHRAYAEEVGRRVRRARERQGLSRAALALLAGKRPSYIACLECGTPGYVDDAVLAALAPALEVPASQLAPTLPTERALRS